MIMVATEYACPCAQTISKLFHGNIFYHIHIVNCAVKWGSMLIEIAGLFSAKLLDAFICQTRNKKGPPHFLYKWSVVLHISFIFANILGS